MSIRKSESGPFIQFEKGVPKLLNGTALGPVEMLQELNLQYKQTIIMITHDSEAASRASRIIEMRDGRILNRVQNLFYAMEQKRV